MISQQTKGVLENFFETLPNRLTFVDDLVVSEISHFKGIPGVKCNPHEIISLDGLFYMPRNWAFWNFGIGNFWYQKSSESATNWNATIRDIDIICRALTSLEIDLNQSLRVCDFSCGEGRIARKLKHIFPFWDILGVEPIAEPLEMARMHAKDECLPNLSFISDKPGELATYKNSMDVVLLIFNCAGYNFNVTEYRNLLETSLSLLRPGGILLFDIRSPEYQKQKYSNPAFLPPVELFDNRFGTSRFFYQAMEFYHSSVLAGVEMVYRLCDSKTEILQLMPFGWYAPDESELHKLIFSIGGCVVDVMEESYGIGQGEKGERVLFSIQKL